MRRTVGLLALSPLAFLLTPIDSNIAQMFGRHLASRVEPAALSDTPRLDGIIVLGGSKSRVREALRLAGSFPDAMVLLSGPGASEVAMARASAHVRQRLVIDERPKNTYENALKSKELLKPNPDQRWALVTSAVHMPRALGSFQAASFPVLPWPVGDAQGPGKMPPARVWHEVLGLIAYRILGRTDALYPRCTDAPCTARTIAANSTSPNTRGYSHWARLRTARDL